MAVAELRAALATPLIAGESVIGTLVLFHESPDHFTDDHRRIAMRVSDQIAAVIENSLVFERTQEESVTDALTGLPNTRFLFPHLSRELARASRLNSPMAVLLLDLDRLKHINDTFGHLIGDRALRAVAAVFRGGIRPYDVCVRYGGDEFIVLLSDCGAEQAEAKRLELKRAVEALPFVARERLPVKLTISAGAAVFPEDGRELRRTAPTGRLADVQGQGHPVAPLRYSSRRIRSAGTPSSRSARGHVRHQRVRTADQADRRGRLDQFGQQFRDRSGGARPSSPGSRRGSR